MRYFVPFLFCCTLMAEVANMSGSWALNEKRSRFGDNPHPSQVFLKIEHNEPKLKYSGNTNHANEGQINDFQFDGAIDGKEYIGKQDNGDRRVTFRRVNDNTVESLSKLAEGELSSRETVSSDGRTLERRMTFRGKDGKTRRWVEIYEKKQ
jgi:hypothetical protein